jgi:hypothetical protein
VREKGRKDGALHALFVSPMISENFQQNFRTPAADFCDAAPHEYEGPSSSGKRARGFASKTFDPGK